MTRKELEELGFTVKENGRIDFGKPPKGKMFMPVPTDEDDIRMRGIDRRFVTMHRFSATTMQVVMELVDEESYERARDFIAGVKAECKEKERRNRCKIISPKTGKEISCPECISCYSDECPVRRGMEVRTDKFSSLDDMAELVKSSVCTLDPTADEAVANADWNRFKEKLRSEEPVLVKIIEWDEYGYDRDEILVKLDRKKSEKSWYYYQWKRIRDRWEKYYNG